MRDPNRIDKFCDELARIWKIHCNDWRFGQMMVNILGQMSQDGRDPFFPEEAEMMRYIKKYFGEEE